ncbi:hypothetical protein [Chryseobacterium sp. CT-SW4]|uniref:hypothetical protein n=1 Tax=Chryseobacterium sp. SW-1 TaxID=3157343 RepID=UPI003B015515
MEDLIYHTLEDFKDNLKITFVKSDEVDYLSFLESEKKKYERFFSSVVDKEKDLLCLYRDKFDKVCFQINNHFPIKERIIVYNVLDMIPTDNDIEYLENVLERKLSQFEKSLITNYPQFREKLNEEFEKPMSKILPYHEIINFLGYSIKEEANKIYYTKIAGIESNKNDEKSKFIDLKPKQTQKIGLLIQSGIVDFLRAKYPTITNNQIAGFFELISQEPLRQKSTNTHFTKDKNSPKYPIRNKQDKTELSLILSRFGMRNL